MAMQGVAQECSHTYNDPLNKTDPLGLRPADCKFSGNGCRYVVEDLGGYASSNVASTRIGGPGSGWHASDYRSESIGAGKEAGIDPRMVYAIFHREAKFPRGPALDQGLYQCWLVGLGCDFPSLGPTNFEVKALEATLKRHPELLDGLSGVGYGSYSSALANAAWLLIDIGDRQAHAAFAARATAYRLADLNSALNGLIVKHRISSITLLTFEKKRSEEPDSFFLFRSSLLGLGWFGGGEMRDGRTVEQGVYRMEQALTGAGYAKANVSGSSQCYVNVYGQSFTAASGALDLASRATC